MTGVAGIGASGRTHPAAPGTVLRNRSRPRARTPTDARSLTKRRRGGPTRSAVGRRGAGRAGTAEKSRRHRKGARTKKRKMQNSGKASEPSPSLALVRQAGTLANESGSHGYRLPRRHQRRRRRRQRRQRWRTGSAGAMTPLRRRWKAARTRRKRRPSLAHALVRQAGMLASESESLGFRLLSL